MRPPAFGIPVDRILLSVWSGLPPGEGIPGVYEALLMAFELNATGRFCLLTAMLDVWLSCLKSSGVPLRICIASMLLARLLVEEFLRLKTSSVKDCGISKSDGATLCFRNGS